MEEIDRAYKCSNEKIREFKAFCEKQHIKFIAHVTRLGNNDLQKQFLFCTTLKTSSSRWKKISEITGLDESQLRRKMIDRKEFQQLLSLVYGNARMTGAPDEDQSSNRSN